jgi:UDP-GlcNAc:undecaprenyl-phosphate/decaprenyl-phosphate GlcNAc-1-phosphate transferase
LASLPVFIGGVIEDIIIRISPLKRMIAILVSIVMMFILLDVNINFLGFGPVDYLLSNSIVSLLFTLLIVGGIVNAINIIDGYNGLVTGYSITVLIAIAYIANILGDDLVVQLSLILTSSLLGVFIFNFPFGKIFMGDGGAYFVGFMMAVIGLMLGIRNEEVSHWFILLLFIYPLYETAFSMYRKKIVRGTSPSQPDGYHLHMMIYKRLVKHKRFKNNKVMQNSITSPFLWALSLVGIIPAVIWYDNQVILIIWAFIFMIIYTIIYRRIVHFKFKFKK